MDYAWVARKVGISLRNEILEFWHHRVVAPLTPAEQKDWLNKAATNGWSRPPERAAVLPGAGGRRLVLLHAVHRVRALQRPRTMPVVRPGAQAAGPLAPHMELSFSRRPTVRIAVCHRAASASVRTQRSLRETFCCLAILVRQALRSPGTRRKITSCLSAIATT